MSAIPVEIFGRVYHVRAEDDKQYVLNLAKMIHDKMTEVDRATNTIDSVRVAVLAALNLADEYCRLKKKYENRILELEAEKERLLRLVENALAEDAPNTLPDA